MILDFDNKVYDYIVEKALEYNLGARGLKSICESILTEHMFEAKINSKIFIDLKYDKIQIEKSNFKKAS